MVNCLVFAICYFRPPEKWCLQNFCSTKKWMMLVIVDGNVFKVLTLPNNLVIICGRQESCVLLTLHDSWKMCVFSAKIWFVKTLTRIVKYESQVIKSTLLGSTQTTENMRVPPFSLVISVIWILLVRVIKTQNQSLEESWFLKLLRNSSKFILIFAKVFKNLGDTYPLAVRF